MRTPRWLLLAVSLLACEPTGVEDADTVELTLRLTLAGGRDVGPAPARVYVFTDNEPVPRFAAFPDNGEACALDTTPVTVCTFSVPRNQPVSLIAAESDPAVVVRFALKSPQDTMRDRRYVEFTGWTDCPDRPERGLCVARPGNDITIEGNYQLMQLVTVYQTGAARMDYVTIAAAPTLKVPAQNGNILDLAGCRRWLQSPTAIPCDSVRVIGDTPYHRFTAYVPRQTIVGMFPLSGLETEFLRWDGDCIPSGIYGVGVCSLISPDVSGPAITLTVRFSWWECADGPADRDKGNCVLRN